MTSFLRKAALAAATITAIQCTAQQASYRIAKTFPVPGDGKWDYLAISPSGKDLYIAHGTEVNIVNRKSGAVSGTIGNTPGVHGIAFAEKNGKGFTSNGKENMVTVFDLATNKETAKIKTGENPDAIMLEPFSGKILVCNGKSKDLTIISPENNEVIATIALGGKPETAVSDEKGHLFVNLEDKSEIVEVDMKSMKVTAHWPLEKGTEPSGLAIDRKHHLVFAGCDNKVLAVVNTQTGKPQQFVPIGEGCDGVAFNAATGEVFSSNGEGTLTVIRRNEKGIYFVAQTLITQKGARTLTVDEHDGSIYLPVAAFQPQNTPGTSKPAIQAGTFKILVAAH